MRFSASMIRIGIIGKTNTGKTTFFNAATKSNAEISNYPFTTKKPNFAAGQVQTLCVCRELHVTDKPRNSTCIDGWRFVPVEIIDLPGLIKGAWAGRGLGTQFLNVVAEADALLHIVDASGSVDEEGKITRPGMGNPVIDVYDIEEEMILWFKVAIDRALVRVRKRTIKKTLDIPLSKELAGIGVRRVHVTKALEEAGLAEKSPKDWKDDDARLFAEKIRAISKPTVIIANKMDLAEAEKNFERLRTEFKSQLVIPIKYVPGQEAFRVLDESRLTKDQAWALAYVEQRVFTKLMRTGVQFAINSCVFKLLGLNAVYPVEDPKTFADRKGNVLPDTFLIPNGQTTEDLAKAIHTDLANRMLYAIDARSGLRIPTDYTIRDRDVISIVAASKKKS